MARMRGTSPGVWAYNDLLGTIRGHGGFLASVAELDAFVEPTNFPDMIRQLEKKNAVVIAGSSGTGKTLAASALCNQARKRNGALDIVVVNPNIDHPLYHAISPLLLTAYSICVIISLFDSIYVIK